MEIPKWPIDRACPVLLGTPSETNMGSLSFELFIYLIKLFSSIDEIVEAHRFTSFLYCVTRISRQLVRQTYVLPLLMSVLPGNDINDIEKTSITVDFLGAILMLLTCVD
ncbi:unnamed protein product [Adineta steineri]|uniref:Proteasome activator Blm10 middle HEAT repeats region domain-containing protein n=1 Tax=Adineta steineri TaxID=433720 RepID=A0A819Q457_9BILA|nr:unnamed protein product [Adineta steineri]CAF4018826.1 unnamed protein product [Adineta steineri]